MLNYPSGDISGLTYLTWSASGTTYTTTATIGDYFIYSQFNGGGGVSCSGADIVASCNKPSVGGYNQYEIIYKATATSLTFYCSGNYMISKLSFS